MSMPFIVLQRGVAINRPVQVDLGVVDYSDSEFIVTFYIYDTAKQRNPYNVSVRTHKFQ